MDTLCIPVQVAPPGIPFTNEELGDVKKKAIDKMNIVYSCCTHTLVLDAEMRMIPVSADNPTKLAYSQCCGWTTRSWTLQEGCLPPSTVYALADGIYFREAKRYGAQFNHPALHVRERIRYILRGLGMRFISPNLFMISHGGTPDTVAGCFSLSVYRDIWISYSTQYFSIWDNVNNRRQPKHTPSAASGRYAKIWNELLDRASSQPADTPAIFANLLGVSAYEVLKRNTEEDRVAFIIRQQKALPVEVLYNTGPRLQERMLTQVFDSGMAQSRDSMATLEGVSEETIGLLDMSELHTRSFKNGWVPALIGGDRISQTLEGRYYLKVFEHCLRIHKEDGETSPSMYTTTETEIPTSAFIIDSGCPTEDTITVINRVIDSPSQATRESPDETVLGHCFIYDVCSMLAMSKGIESQAQGVHLVILSRNGNRLTTRYCDPIRLTLTTKEKQSVEMLPSLKCLCKCQSTEEFVDILYGKSICPLGLTLAQYLR
jgi:hypothetical protein